MSKHHNDLHFSMSSDELVNQSLEKEALLDRDQADLDSRGITTTRITAFGALRDTFTGIPTDETMKALITGAITSRDAESETMRTMLREVIGIAKNTFGENDYKYKAFGSTNLSGLNASQLGILSDTVVAQGTANLTAMAPHGLTNTMLTDITAQKTIINNKIKDVKTAETNAVLKTGERHLAANNLFDEMRAMCDIAQTYYVDRDPEKASEYVIYQTTGNQQQRNGIVKIGKIVSRKLMGITKETIFSIQVKSGNALEFYFSQTEGGTPTGPSITVNVDSVSPAKFIGYELGFDSTTGINKFCIRNNGTLDSVYKVIVG